MIILDDSTWLSVLHSISFIYVLYQYIGGDILGIFEYLGEFVPPL